MDERGSSSCGVAGLIQRSNRGKEAVLKPLSRFEIRKKSKEVKEQHIESLRNLAKMYYEDHAMTKEFYKKSIEELNKNISARLNQLR